VRNAATIAARSSFFGAFRADYFLTLRVLRGSTFFLLLQHNPANAGFEQNHVEIQEEADPATGQAEIGQQLRLVNRLNRLYRFDFDDDARTDQQIKPVTGIQRRTVVGNGHRHLPVNGKTTH
jgi:hypothetical protein